MAAEALIALAMRLRAMSTLGAAIAKEAAPGILAAAQATAAAGTTPDGKAWAPRKADGARAFANAAGGLSVRADGDVVVLVLSGAYIYAQGKRSILPTFGKALPPAYVMAITDAANAVMRRAG